MPNLDNVLLCNYRIYLSSLSMLNTAAVRQTRLSKIKTLTLRQVLGANMHHHTKFHQNRSNGCRDMAIQRFFKWRPFAILNLLGTYWDHPRWPLGGLCRCAKFGWNRCSSFDNVKLSIFRQFGLKNLFTPPKWGFRRISPQKLRAISTKPRQWRRQAWGTGARAPPPWSLMHAKFCSRSNYSCAYLSAELARSLTVKVTSISKSCPCLF